MGDNMNHRENSKNVNNTCNKEHNLFIYKKVLFIITRKIILYIKKSCSYLLKGMHTLYGK